MSVYVPEPMRLAPAGAAVAARSSSPGRGSFEALTKRQKECALRAARLALVEVMAEAMSETL